MPVDAEGKQGGLCFLREMNYALPDIGAEPEGQRTRQLRILPDISGYSTVFMPGSSASFVFKTSASLPHVTRLRGDNIRGLSSFDSAAAGCAKGFVYADSTVCPLVSAETANSAGRCPDIPITIRHNIRLLMASAKNHHR